VQIAGHTIVSSIGVGDKTGAPFSRFSTHSGRIFEMGKIFKTVAVTMGALLLNIGFSNAGSQPPAVGGVLPDFSLAVPNNVDHQSYLGVTGKEAFSIPEIKAEVVIVQIFSMY
jgi:hypothetical protein